MAKKEKWITCEEGESADIEKFSTDPLKFGIEVLDWFWQDGEEEWKKIYEQDNSQKIKDHIKEITNGKIEYDWCDAMFLNTIYGSYIKAY